MNSTTATTRLMSQPAQLPSEFRPPRSTDDPSPAAYRAAWEFDAGGALLIAELEGIDAVRAAWEMTL